MRPPVNKAGFRAGRDNAAVQENLELLTGQRGNGLDRAITVRELSQLGFIGVSRGTNGGVITKPLPPVMPDLDKPVEIPHAPLGFAAFGGFGAIMLEWKNPTFNGFAYAEIWRAAPNVDGSAPHLEQAVVIATTPATVFGDIVNPGSTFYYWCRFVNVNNFPGPFNHVDGIKVSTSQNIGDIIDDLGNQMKDSELIQDLVTDISDGDKAAQDAINAAQEAINAAQEDLNAAKESLNADINAAKEAINAAQEDINAAKENLNADINAAKEELANADKTLQASIDNAKNAFDKEIARVEVEYKAVDVEASAAIKDLENTVADANGSIVEIGTQIRTEFKNADKQLESSITELSTTLTNADKALAEKLSTLETGYKAADASLTGSISELSQVVTNADQALAQKIESIKTEYKAADVVTNAAVSSLTKTVSDGDKALAVRINGLNAQWEGADDDVLTKANANITEATKVLTNADQSLAQKIESVKTEYKAADVVTNAAVSSLAKTVSDGDKALAEKLSTLETGYKAADASLTGSISELSQVVTNADRALAQKIELVKTEYKAADAVTNAAVSSLTKTVSDGDKALAVRINGLNAQWEGADDDVLTKANANITEATKVLTNADQSLAESVKKLEANYKAGDSALSGKITALDKVTVDRDKVVSNKVDTVQSTINKVSATVQQNSSAISTINKDGSTAHKAMWNTKAQAGDIKAGIGILAKSDGTSQVAVSASQFFVFDPNKAGVIQPLFAIDKGNVVIPKALIESATIQILNAQTIVADKVKVGISITSPKIEGAEFLGGWAKFGVGGPHSGYHTYITSDGAIYTDNIIATNGQFSGVIAGSNIRGSTITGSAIQASYIAADVRMLTLSWANQEQYGTMSVEELEKRGITPYMGFNVAVVDKASVRGGSAVAYLNIRSYDHSNKADYFRYTRKLITPTITGSGVIESMTTSVGGTGNIIPPSHTCRYPVTARIEVFFDGHHIQTHETGNMTNGQSINNTYFTAKANIYTSITPGQTGGGNSGNWQSFHITCTGSVHVTLKQQHYNGSRGKFGCRVYIYKHFSQGNGSGWIIADGYSINDTALNDYTPSNQGPN